MTTVIEVSPEALGIATLEVIGGVVRHLVQRQLMTDADVAGLLVASAQGQRALGVVLPDNEAAAMLLEEMAKYEIGKWRESVVVLPGPC